MSWQTKEDSADPLDLGRSWSDEGTARAGVANAPGARLELGESPACRRRSGALAPPEVLDFADVYERNVDFVWRSLRLLGVSGDALNDALQDVFSTVARQLDGFEGRSSLRTWVFGIAQNIASNHRRLRARKLDSLVPLGEGLIDREPTPHAHAEGKEAAAQVLRFCAALDEDRRAVFVLGLLEGVPAAEIAALLGVPLNTVYSRMHALRQALKKHLSRREVET